MEQLKKDILKILKQDSRFTAQQIAFMLDVDTETVASIIAQLENDKIIVKYTTIINNEKVEHNLVSAIIEVKVTPEKNKGFDAIAADIYKFDEVKSVYLMSGGYDLSVMIEGGSLREVAMFVSEKLSQIPSVISTATHFVLKNYKIENIIVEDENETTRIEFN